MGGFVTVALRQEGQVDCRRCHTSQLAGLFWTDTFFDRPALPKAWVASAFVPHDYGIVVIDADHHWVGSLQGACSLAQMSVQELESDVTSNGQMSATAAAKAARRTPLTLHTFCEPLGGGPALHHPTPLPAIAAVTATALRRALKKAQAQAAEDLSGRRLTSLDTWRFVQREAPAWRLDHFDELKAEGWAQMCQALLDRDWIPSERDAAQWEAYLNHKTRYGGAPDGPPLTAGLGPLRAVYRRAELEEALAPDAPGAASRRAPRM